MGSVTRTRSPSRRIEIRRLAVLGVVLAFVAAASPAAGPTFRDTSRRRPPPSKQLPRISGTAVEGQTLNASIGSWPGPPTRYDYQWRACDTAGGSCSDIAGATSPSYLLSANEVGKTMRVVVTGAHTAGSASATSAATASVSAFVSAFASAEPPSPDCTIYVAPNGSSTNTGSSPDSPLTIAAANAKSVPGSVICLGAGTYRSGVVQVHSGTPSAWIVWRSYNGDPVIRWDTSQSRNVMFKVTDGAAYVEFNGLTFDGASVATAGVGCYNHSHHIRVLHSHVLFMGAAGISIMNCDYATIVGNTVYRFGDAQGWSSGISFNWESGAFWFDQASGFHNVVADNFVAGGVDNSSYNSDGNGIILDLGGDLAPTLIADNVVYMNGGRGIATLKTTGKVFVVNNTLYKNGLDLRMSVIGEAVANASSNQTWANNVVSAWEPRYTYQLLDGSTGITFDHDTQFGGLGTRYIGSSIAGDPRQIGIFNPSFIAAPFVDPGADRQWRNPPTSATLGNGLALSAESPLVDAGIDPRTLRGLDPALLAGIQEWAMTAIDGASRPVGSGFDYGAYER
jgi:hypothetical protein